MVHALYERGIAPDLLIGTSVGALNAAFLASRPATTATAEELAAIWRGPRRSDTLALRPATRSSAAWPGGATTSSPTGRCAGSSHGTCDLSGWSRRPPRCTWLPSTWIVLPAVNSGHIPPTDFGHAGQLITSALAAARTALAAGAPNLTSAGMTRAGLWLAGPDVEVEPHG